MQAAITPSPHDASSPQMRELPPLIRSLLRPEAYPHPAENLCVHETHISLVILAGPYAYKLKKHVNFGFLDFSTFARRAADCAAEVTLNRRLCPNVYRSVTQIVEHDGAYWAQRYGSCHQPQSDARIGGG